MSSEITFKIEGISPLLMHNGQLANPLNPLAKQIKQLTSQKNKTEELYSELQRLEFRAGLYLSRDGVVEIPSEMLEKGLVDGAKKNKLGKRFTSAIAVERNAPLDYGEQLSVDQLWERYEEFVDVRSVIINRKRVMRARPIFHKWALTFTVSYNADLVDADNIRTALATCGAEVGIGDYRPKFGRFLIVE